MIQRIQSLYVFAAACMLSYSGGHTLGVFMKSAATANICAHPFTGGLWWMFILYMLLIAGAAVTTFITIFQFKNRLRQMRTIKWAALCTVLAASTYLVASFMSATTAQLFHCAVLPILALLVNYLALRAIRSDERKVRAADRIR